MSTPVPIESATLPTGDVDTSDAWTGPTDSSKRSKILQVHESTFSSSTKESAFVSPSRYDENIDQGEDKYLVGTSLDKPKQHDDHMHDDHYVVGPLSVFSKGWFVLGSALYVAAESSALDYLKWYEGIPYNVLSADDDTTWWGYYNTTGVIPAYDDDVQLSGWYNSTFMEDDIVFQVQTRNADAIAQGGALVTLYMILYFSAALCFLVMAMLEMYIHRAYIGYVLLYTVMVIAALFGIVSSMYTEKDEHLSNVFNCVSVHLFALDAWVFVYLVWKNNRRDRLRIDPTGGSDVVCGGGGGDLPGLVVDVKRINNKGLATDGLSTPSHHLSLWDALLDYVITWERLGSVCFVIGTLLDVVTSYFYLYRQENVALGRSAIAAAVFWLLSSLFYMAVTVVEYHHYRITTNAHHDDEEDEIDENKNNNDQHRNKEDGGGTGTAAWTGVWLHDPTKHAEVTVPTQDVEATVTTQDGDEGYSTSSDEVIKKY